MNREMFAISTYCSVHSIDLSFISSLIDEGLITVTNSEEGDFIEEEQLHELEIYTRWHHELGINPEGMDAMRHMVDKLRHLQAEIGRLRTKLRFYEADDLPGESV